MSSTEEPIAEDVSHHTLSLLHMLALC